MSQKGFYFAIGAAVGAIVGCVLTKNYYKKRSDEEIESVKEHYRSKMKLNFIDNSEERKHELTEEKSNMSSDMEKYPKFSEKDYTRYSELSGIYQSDEALINEQNEKYTKKEEVIPMKMPYIIMPEEVGDKDYGISTMYYFQDGILTDDNENPIEDPADLIGEIDVEDHFGEYEDDTVYIRNDDMETDFEICADTRNFSEL